MISKAKLNDMLQPQQKVRSSRHPELYSEFQVILDSMWLFEGELFHVVSCILIPGLQLAMLYGEVVEPSQGEVLFEEVDH